MHKSQCRYAETEEVSRQPISPLARTGQKDTVGLQIYRYTASTWYDHFSLAKDHNPTPPLHSLPSGLRSQRAYRTGMQPKGSGCGLYKPG
jgi:hypothetical protein